MPYSRPQLFELSKKVGRSWRTLQYWAAQGCDLNDPASLEAFLQAKELRKTNVQKAKERRSRAGTGAGNKKASTDRPLPTQKGNGEVPVGKRGAQFALQRLEIEEAQAHARLQQALVSGDQLAIEQAQMFWVRCVESLRKLDLSIELVRRDAEEQVSLKTAENALLYCAEWMRVAISTFLSAETNSLMAFRDRGEFRHYFWQRFRGILDLVVKNADRTNSAIPSWGKRQIETAWNLTMS
jgi:hypothetical protein